jgi:DNA-binding IclR family transcriptional regulator
MTARRVSATETSITILEAVRGREGAGVTEIAEATGGSKANVHKHLRTLQAAGFVREQDGEYHLGHRFLSFAMVAKRRESVYREGVTNIEKLADFTGATTTLVVREGLEAVYLHTVTPGGETRAEPLEGKRALLPDVAGGLAMLSAYSPEELRQLLEQTVDSPARIESIHESLIDRDEGAAVTHPLDGSEGPEEITAPIVTDEGPPAGAIGLRHPTTSDEAGRVETDLRKLVRNTAQTVSKRIAMTE